MAHYDLTSVVRQHLTKLIGHRIYPDTKDDLGTRLALVIGPALKENKDSVIVP